MTMVFFSFLVALICVCHVLGLNYEVKVVERDSQPRISFIDKTTSFQQVFNPTWIEPSKGTQGRRGLLIRTQNCDSPVNSACVFCGGSQEKASVLTFAEETADGKFSFVDSSSVVFGPSDSSDSWGTEDPRMKFNHADGLYYMFYTAYNGSAIFLNLATSPNPTDKNQWTKRGPVFPSMQNSKSGAVLLRDTPPHYLFWGDHDIRVAKSSDPTVWPEIGDILISPRSDHFDSKLVESGPPPLPLSNGDYLFFYNSAENGWPDDLSTSYNVGYLILDGKDPTIIKARSESSLMGSEFSWEKGVSPYACNVPNVVFLEAAHPVPGTKDTFKVYFGGADATIGSAVIEVILS